jgi:hypothetical protein
MPDVVQIQQFKQWIQYRTDLFELMPVVGSKYKFHEAKHKKENKE